MKSILFAVLMAVFSLVSAVECTRPKQDGCWDLLIINGKKGHNDLDRVSASAEAREERINTLGPRLMACYQAKKCEAAKPRTFLVYVWNQGKGTPVSYRVNGRKAEGGKVSAGRIEDVTGKVPTTKIKKAAKLGSPRVYRLHAEGKEPIGVSAQFGWDTISKATILIRVEDDLAVYPHDDSETNEGLWIIPGQLAVLRQNNVPGSIAPFISKE